jgi:hypothetical protein
MFVGEAGAYPRVERLKGLPDKHSNLLRKSVIYGRKKFDSAGPWLNQTFLPLSRTLNTALY